MTEEVRVDHGVILIGDDCYECNPIRCTPHEARELAAQILAAATEADGNLAAIKAACADGHDWGSYMNSWHFWPDTKVTVRYCKRDGCDGRIEEPGWVEFAGRLHYQPISPRQARRVDCYGPGCEHCDNEKLAADINRVLADELVAALEQTVFGKEGQ